MSYNDTKNKYRLCHDSKTISTFKADKKYMNFSVFLRCLEYNLSF